MPDNTPSFVDFSRCRNNRFSTLEMASKNRLAYPSSQLHWFNAPASMNDEKLRKVCKNISITFIVVFYTELTLYLFIKKNYNINKRSSN